MTRVAQGMPTSKPSAGPVDVHAEDASHLTGPLGVAVVGGAQVVGPDGKQSSTSGRTVTVGVAVSSPEALFSGRRGPAERVSGSVGVR